MRTQTLRRLIKLVNSTTKESLKALRNSYVALQLPSANWLKTSPYTGARKPGHEETNHQSSEAR